MQHVMKIKIGFQALKLQNKLLRNLKTIIWYIY
jgi:hypothetical protein